MGDIAASGYNFKATFKVMENPFDLTQELALCNASAPFAPSSGILTFATNHTRDDTVLTFCKQVTLALGRKSSAPVPTAGTGRPTRTTTLPRQKRKAGRTGGTRHPTHSAQEGRRPRDKGTPVRRHAPLGSLEKAFLTEGGPLPTPTAPAGPAGGNHGSAPQTDRARGLRYRQETAPRAPAARASAGCARYQSRSHSPSGARAPQAPEAHGYATNGEQDRTTPRPLHTPCTHHPGGAVASAQACARQANSPPTWGRHDTGSLPPAKRGTHGSPLLLPPRPLQDSQGARAAATPGRGRWGTGVTPPLGFRHLRQDLDRSWGPARLAWRQGDGERCPATSQDPDPPPSPRGRRRESGGRAGFRTPAAHTPPTGGEGRTRGLQARRSSATLAMNGRPSSGAA
ncbi:translation initiation factor IF-2 [Oryctolagus cuniculus]|uniref:translation initiation factor IF-2 n=1 Tax=Oryctolagus cuniculus TaxID=9986 RepID=UPI00387A5B12